MVGPTAVCVESVFCGSCQSWVDREAGRKLNGAKKETRVGFARICPSRMLLVSRPWPSLPLSKLHLKSFAASIPSHIHPHSIKNVRALPHVIISHNSMINRLAAALNLSGRELFMVVMASLTGRLNAYDVTGRACIVNGQH